MVFLLQDSSGTTLMDLITADPSTASASASTTTSSSASTQPAQSSGYAASPPKSSSGGLPTALGKPAGEKRSKRAALMQIQNDTISAARAALNPVRTNINILPQKHKQKQKKVQTRNLFFAYPFSSYVLELSLSSHLFSIWC